MPIPAGADPSGADQLATPQDLASLLQLDWAGLTAAEQATMTLLVEVATAVVQEAAGGQRIVEVVGDTATLIGATNGWLDLPQRPVSAVTSVTLDGNAVTEGTTTGTYRRFGSRLWRDCGWATCYTEPSTVVVVNTHGYAAGSQDLQLARSAVLSLARGIYSNPSGATREAIDDYSASYEAAVAGLEGSPHLRAALRRQYGRRAGLVRIGG